MVKPFGSCIEVVAFRDCCSASSKVSRSRPWISPFRRTRHASYDYARLAETQSSTGRFTKWNSGDDDGRRASWARNRPSSSAAATGDSTGARSMIRLSPPMSPSSTTPATPPLLDTLRGFSRWVRRSRAPPSRSGLLTFNMNDWPARIDPDETAIGRPTATARRLVEASVSPNTRRAYVGALRRLDAWLDGREPDDASLAAYLAELHDAGRASSSASMAFAGRPSPAGERSARVLAGYRRTAGDREREQARPFGVSDLAAVLATCHRPRRGGAGGASSPTRSPSSGGGSMR